ncbi:MAG: tetratricopeptide repeat protein [Deltaproteobacteria bacterium]|nr:tetratricopeptide repeat protein [Deltaproteobacteria bacterium]
MSYKLKKKKGNIAGLPKKSKKSAQHNVSISQALQTAVQHHQAGDLHQAEKFYNRVLALDPGNAEAHHYLGVLAYQVGKQETAVNFIQKALHLNPHLANAHNTLGVVLRDLGRLDEASASYRNALSSNPDFTEAYSNLGNVLKDQGRLDEAVANYRKALSVNPDDPEAHSSLLFALNYLPDISQQEIREESVRWGERYAKKLVGEGVGHESRQEEGHCKKIRIGYVSPDFYHHPVGRFILPVLASHNRHEFEVYCYSGTPRPDAVTGNIKKHADHWLVTNGLNDGAMIRRIKDDRIDILVDLAGHSGGNRLMVFAGRPASIQVSWLGYVNTTGLPVMDYRITDDIVDPVGESEGHYTEILIRLKNGFFCFSPPENSPEVGDSPVRQTGLFTFGSFNNLCKINDSVVSLWVEILKRVPRSRLMLKSKAFADENVKRYFGARFFNQGLDENRLILLPGSSFAQYLQSYQDIDVCLDPFPHNGHTVSCDALWMGCPVISLRGERYAARMGADLLTRIGLSELIAENREQYVNKAVELAENSDRLDLLRSGMRTRVKEAPFCDAQGFTSDLEGAFRKMMFALGMA